MLIAKLVLLRGVMAFDFKMQLSTTRCESFGGIVRPFGKSSADELTLNHGVLLHGKLRTVRLMSVLL
jgi:hypothetical protein